MSDRRSPRVALVYDGPGAPFELAGPDAALDVIARLSVARAGDDGGLHEADCFVLDHPGSREELTAAVRTVVAAAGGTPVLALARSAALAVRAVQCGAHDALDRDRADAAAVDRAVRCAIARRRSERRAAEAALRDPLTGLPNRALLDDRLALALARAHRHPAGIAVLFVDLDGFKAVNDTRGHAAGDQVLVEVAARLRHAVRPEDTVVRLGGDEFVVLCEGLARAAVGALARRIEQAVTRPVRLEGGAIRVTPSIGVAHTVRADVAADELLRGADAAMYRAKRRFGPSFALAPAAVGDDLDVRRALHDGELVLHWQPEVELATGRLAGLEALVRWAHPQRGLLGPAAFVPAADALGAAVDLGAWVCGEACRQARRWGLDGVRVGVNVSAAQLDDARLTERVALAAARAGVAPSLLSVELPAAALDASERLARDVGALSALGCRVTLDDFGTATASLGALAELPVDGLKIDGDCVGRAVAGGGARRFVRAVAQLAAGLGVRAVAEGVEGPEHAAMAREAGCELGQGFAFAHPCAAGEAERWLEPGWRFTAAAPAVA